MRPGVDYTLDVDQALTPTGGQVSRSGLLFNINGPWDEQFTRIPGRISAQLGPRNGNYKVVYTAGYNPIPTPLVMAANMAVARARNMSQYGEMVNSESYEKYSVSFRPASSSMARSAVFSPEVYGMLARYRNVAVG
jgi:hypothetical protein